MKIKNFIKKHKLITLLIFLIFILVLSKLYFSQNSLNKEVDLSQEKTNITPTVKTPITKLNDEEQAQLSDQLTKKYYNIKNEEQAKDFLENLTDEERFLIQEIDQNYEFEYILPYETDTFIINEYLKANTLLVTAKGNDSKKSTSDLQKWINENTKETEDPKNIIVVWEN